jgi:hypothetical protein
MLYYSVEGSAHRDDTSAPIILSGYNVHDSFRAHVGRDVSFVSR